MNAGVCFGPAAEFWSKRGAKNCSIYASKQEVIFERTLRTQLYLAKKLGILPAEDKLVDATKEISAMLTSLIHTRKKNFYSQSPSFLPDS